MKTTSWTNERLSAEFTKLVAMEPRLEELAQKARLIVAKYPEKRSSNKLFYAPIDNERYSLKLQMSRLIGHSRGAPELTDDDYLDPPDKPLRRIKLNPDRLQKPRILGGDPYLFSSNAYEIAYEYLYRLTSQ